MLKAIIFDMDGVLINTEPLHFEMWRQTFQKYGLHIAYDIYKECIGSTADYLFEIIAKNYGRDFQNKKVIRMEAAQIKENMLKTQGFPEIPGVPALIKRLRDAGYLLAVASSSSDKYIRENMRILKIESYFQVLYSGENVKHPKPAPDIFLKVAEKLNVLPEECLVIEDSTNGCNAARNAGMKSLGFYNPDSGNQDLSTAISVIDNWKLLDNEFLNKLWNENE